ncbi:MAG: acyl transferase [Saprospiraceae bacterium]|nr:acyl transferase [Saprospiraceae bacterium]
MRNTEISLLKNKIQNLVPEKFDKLALEVYDFQSRYNPVYRAYCQTIKDLNPSLPVPYFMPISAYKTHQVSCLDPVPSFFFQSSGTTASATSRHYLADPGFYLENARKGFEAVYGPLGQFSILALLPHYLERSHSSLVAMVEYFIRFARPENSGFYLYNTDDLAAQLQANKQTGTPTILFGVSFALLDFAQSHPFAFPDLILMETGGMKGRREEITREEVHASLCSAFGTAQVHSEYGMTELCSQAYSGGDGIFIPGATLKIEIHEISDPFSLEKPGKTGIICVTDLANLESCAFIATDDLGIALENGRFRVQGRLDASDIRGCNLLVE